MPPFRWSSALRWDRLELLWIEGEMTFVPDLDFQDFYEFHVCNSIHYNSTSGI